MQNICHSLTSANKMSQFLGGREVKTEKRQFRKSVGGIQKYHVLTMLTVREIMLCVDEFKKPGRWNPETVQNRSQGFMKDRVE